MRATRMTSRLPARASAVCLPVVCSSCCLSRIRMFVRIDSLAGFCQSLRLCGRRRCTSVPLLPYTSLLGTSRAVPLLHCLDRVMLATPPIHAPLQPLVFPPPGASRSEAPAPPPPAASVEPASSTATSAPHRHAAAARAALEVVQRLSDQVDLPPDGGEPSDDDEQEGVRQHPERPL